MSKAKHPILLVIGTRPEAIKMGPIYREFCDRGLKDMVRVLSTSQHRSLMEPFLHHFGIEVNHCLDSLPPGHTLSQALAAMLVGTSKLLEAESPSWVVVQGDTTSALAAALAGFYANIPVAHVEAGLRSDDLSSPYPEEFNRRTISTVAKLHFAPTTLSRTRLIYEGHSTDQILVTGNTSIDALMSILNNNDVPDNPPIKKNVSILVTMHRRENQQFALSALCHALLRLIDKFPDLEIIFPVHPNPIVHQQVVQELGSADRIQLVPPMDYPTFISAMKNANLIITDSGGVQEEAPTLHTPVLVFRTTTERPEGIEAGVARLIGTNEDALVTNVSELLSNPASREMMICPVSPYGDGKAAERIVDSLLKHCS